MTYYFRYSIMFRSIDCHLCVSLGIKKYFYQILFAYTSAHGACQFVLFDVSVAYDFMICIYLIRLAAKSNLSAAVLVSKVTECSSKWSKPTLQLVHQLWTEHGALLHAHQEVLTMASIGQVCHMILAYSVNIDQPLFSVRLLMSKLLHA